MLFGLFLGGFRATPLNLAAGADAHRHALRHSGARFAIVDHDTGPDFNVAGAAGLTVIGAGDLAGAQTSCRAPRTPDELITHCSARLGAFRAPERIHVVADPPRGPSGKVQRIRPSALL